MTQKFKLSRIIAESSILIAFSIILGLIKVLDLPYGGSITLASLLPIIIISMRFGIKWGCLAGFVRGAFDLLTGLSVLSYVTGWQSVVAVIVLDYLLAYALVGLSGIFRKIKNKENMFLIGALFGGFMRYICHVISGCTVWAGLSIPTSHAFVYSIGYNATYMVPEIIILCIVGYYVSSFIDIEGEKLSFKANTKVRKGNLVPFYVDSTLIVATLVYVVIAIFKVIQDSETGDFVFANIKNANWLGICIVVGACILICLAFNIIYSLIRKKKESKE